jgi:hypothetical protein
LAPGCHFTVAGPFEGKFLERENICERMEFDAAEVM